MSLLFDNKDVECECSSHIFKQEKIFGLEKKYDNDNNLYFKSIQPKYLIKCALCGKTLKLTDKSLIKNFKE